MIHMHRSFLLLALLAVGLDAQEVRATFGGRITDSSGAVVPDAVITVTSGDTGVKRETRSNAQGNWIVEFLLPGRYRVSATAPGFKTTERNDIELQTSDNKQIDTQLEIGTPTQSVEVTAGTPLIDTTSATSGTVITTKEITEMPSSSHVVTLLALLSPGVVQQDQNGNVVHLWSYLGASQFTADGGRNNTWSNTFQLDGMANTKTGGNIAFVPPMDSVLEFRVQTNAYDASIGRQAGSTINMQTRAGGNAYHGSLYEFNQNNMLNANLFQTNLVGGVVPPIHFNEFGGTFGGVVRIPKVYNGTGKTFFFVSFDDTYNTDPRPGSTRSMPAALERSGDFSQSFTTQAGQRFPIQIYDPASVDKTTGNRLPFPQMMIPKVQLSQIAQNILKYVPLPNTAGDPTSNASNNFISSATRTDTFPALSIRADQNWSNSHRSFVTLRWAHLHEFLDDFFHNAATGNYHERVPRSLGLDHVWTVSSNKVLDLRANVNRYEEPNFDKGSGFDPRTLGLPASFTSQLQKPSFPRITGFAGDFGTSEGGAYTNNTYYTWAATLTHAHGNHTMRYGAEYWVLQEADRSIGNQGQFDFNSNWTRQNNQNSGGTGVGSTFASFLLGLPSGGNVPVNANGFYSQRFGAFYFQDDWRVTGRLTLNLGMRWDYEAPVTERYNRLTSEFDLNQINPISGAAQAAYAAILSNPANASNTGVQALAQLVPAGAFKVPGVILFAGVNGQTRGFAQPDRHEWQPRLGLAYQIFRNTVIRGGVGRFTQASYEKGGQNGFSRTTSLIATQDNFLTPYDTLANPFQGGILAPTGSSLGALTNLGGGVDFNSPHPDRFYSWEYSVHLQRQIGSWLLEAGYSHNKTYNIWQSRQQDNPAPAVWRQLNGPQFDASGRPLDTLLWNVQVPNPFYHLAGVSPSNSIYSSQTTSVNRLLFGDPLLGQISMGDIPGLGSNRFDALLVKAEHRFTKDFSIINSFTFSKLFEDTSLIDGSTEINGKPIVEHKLGGEDRPLHFSTAPIWEIPVGRGKRLGRQMPRLADAIAGGWELTGLFTIQSGVPVVFSTKSFFSGKDFALPGGGKLSEWFDVTQFYPFPSKNTDISTYPSWTGVLNLPGASYKPAPGDSAKNGVYQDFGTYIRNYPTRWGDVRASRVNNVDAGLYKNVRFNERVRLQLRFNVFNLFNHPRFAAPDTNPGSSTFGRVTNYEQNQARAVELGARLSF
jgi:hypothetical protein